MSNRQLPKRTQECLAACAAVGLSYWSGHPARNCVWAVDDHQVAHVVRILDGTAQHICATAIPVAAEQCAGDDVAIPYKPPGAA